MGKQKNQQNSLGSQTQQITQLAKDWSPLSFKRGANEQKSLFIGFRQAQVQQGIS